MREVADAPTPATRDRFHIPTAPDGSPAIYLAGPVARAAAADRGGGHRDRARRLGAPRRRRLVRPDATVVHAGRVAPRGDGPDRRRAAGRGGAAQQPDRQHPSPARLVLPADGRRRRILADGPLFPSDRHALTSHLAQRGLDPAADLVVVGPRDGEAIVRTDGPRGGHRRRTADDLALVFLAGVNFATGQAHEIERLTAAGRAAGAVVGWDLAHAAGNVELSLHDWDVDFAAWCTYKYLNGGPGALGRDLRPRAPRRATGRSRGSVAGGGCDADARFDPVGPFVPAEGAAGWATSTTPILRWRPSPPRWRSSTRSACPRSGRAPIRADRPPRDAASADLPVEIVTPRDPAARGAQLSLRS